MEGGTKKTSEYKSNDLPSPITLRVLLSSLKRVTLSDYRQIFIMDRVHNCLYERIQTI